MRAAWTRYLPTFIKQRLEGREYLQKVVENIVWLHADNVLRMSIGLFVGVWIARYLGPTKFGLFSFAGAFVGLFSAISTLGLDGIVIRNIVVNISNRDEILGTTFALKLFSGTVTFFIVLIGIFLLRPEDGLSQWLVGIISLGMFFQSIDVIDLWFQSQVQSKYTVYAKNIAFMIISAVKVILILFKASILAFAWAGLAEIAIGSGGLLLAYQGTKQTARKWRVNCLLAIELLKDSWPLMLSGVAIMIYMRIDQVMLGIMRGDQEVGIYSAAVRLVEAWYFIPLAVASSVFPSIVEAKSMGNDILYGRLQQLYNIMAFISYLIAIPITLLSGWIIGVLFGNPFREAGPLLAVFIWSILFTNLGVARSTFLTAMNWTKIHLMTVSTGCLLNIILNYQLIPLYGGMGAVISSCISYWFATHGACFVYKPMKNTGKMITKAIFYPKIW